MISKPDCAETWPTHHNGIVNIRLAADYAAVCRIVRFYQEYSFRPRFAPDERPPDV